MSLEVINKEKLVLTKMTREVRGVREAKSSREMEYQGMVTTLIRCVLRSYAATTVIWHLLVIRQLQQVGETRPEGSQMPSSSTVCFVIIFCITSEWQFDRIGFPAISDICCERDMRDMFDVSAFQGFPFRCWQSGTGVHDVSSVRGGAVPDSNHQNHIQAQR
jgi:hypothetical protein